MGHDGCWLFYVGAFVASGHAKSLPSHIANAVLAPRSPHVVCRTFICKLK